MTEIEAPKDLRKETTARVMAELEATRAWYESNLERLGEMTVEVADLTDGDKWKASLTETGQVENVDGAFFTLAGQKITRFNPDGSEAFGWIQPGLLQKESQIIIPTREGEMEVKTSGFVGIILNEDDHALLTLD
jgi:hypothetical protein